MKFVVPIGYRTTRTILGPDRNGLLGCPQAVPLIETHFYADEDASADYMKPGPCEESTLLAPASDSVDLPDCWNIALRGRRHERVQEASNPQLRRRSHPTVVAARRGEYVVGGCGQIVGLAVGGANTLSPVLVTELLPAVSEEHGETTDRRERCAKVVRCHGSELRIASLAT